MMPPTAARLQGDTARPSSRQAGEAPVNAFPILAPRSCCGSGAGRSGAAGTGPRCCRCRRARSGAEWGGAARSFSQNRWKLKMDIKHVKDYIYWLYYQYLLITCSYVLEPWERSMFHTITVTVFAMVVYTAYVFVPIHIRLAFEFFSQLFGGQPESTVSIVN
ncbi:serine palmitoyltransferase small subunit B isoform X1 [Pezoporus wallicus]|nr:serine palmitoyltransferase small subunit B isoform X1 [Pezoporus wallicus]XP_061308598.1 serine palmitoyltransferase small subunit B isoform X1 [Pezoporus flaviventris]